MPDNINIPFLFQVFQALVLALVTIVTFARKPGEGAMEALNELTDRVIRLEEHVKHIPKGHELHAVAGDVREMRARIEGLVESQRAQTQLINRIDHFLMSQK